MNREGLKGLSIQTDWGELVGLMVEVRREGFPARIGLVDAVTTDGRIAWLAASGAETRVMVERYEGYELWARTSMIPIT